MATEGRTLSDPMEIAEILQLLCKHGPNLAKWIPSVNPSFRSYLDDNNHPSINLKPTKTGELVNWKAFVVCSLKRGLLVMTVSQ